MRRNCEENACLFAMFYFIFAQLLKNTIVIEETPTNAVPLCSVYRKVRGKAISSAKN